MSAMNSTRRFLVVDLSPQELLYAARLGGLNLPFETILEEFDHEDIEAYAHDGVIEAINSSFEHLFPDRYPEDVEADFWETDDILEDLGLSMSGTGTGAFGLTWGGRYDVE